MLKKILFGLGAVLALLVLILMIAPAFIPTSVIKAKIEETATTSLGREVRIDDDPKISLFPARVTVSGLTIDNAAGFEADYFAQVGETDISVKLLPLLGQQVEITKFHLKDPIIHLEASADGGNWIMDGQNQPVEPAPETGGSPNLPNDIRLGDVRLSGGQLTYRTPDGTTYEARDADLTLKLESLAKPLELSGTMTLQGEPTTIDAVFQTPKNYADKGEADLSLDMKVGDNHAEMILALTDELAFDGSLDIDFPALRSLFSLVGTEIGTEKGFERLRLKGPVKGTTSRLVFGEGTELGFDDISGTGALTIDVSGSKPSVKGAVTLGTLDVTPYLPPEPEELKALKAGEKKEFPGWSEAPMDFSALNAVETDIDIKTGEIILPSLTIGESDLSLNSGRDDVTATIHQTALYGGTGKGTIRIKTAGTPELVMDMALNGVDTGALTRELTGVDRLVGIGNVSLGNLSARGSSQADFVRSLNGDISLDLADGHLTGVNLGKIGRTMLSAYDTLTGENGGINMANIRTIFGSAINQAMGPAEETDFNDLDVVMLARNGVINTNNLSIAGPYYEIIGSAEINLPAQSMKIEMTPSVALEGSDVRRKLPFPLAVNGTFNSARPSVDYSRILNSLLSDQYGDKIKEETGIDLTTGDSIEDAIRKKAEDELRKKLFGTPDEEANDGSVSDDQVQEQSPEEALLNAGIGALFGGDDKDDEDGDQ